jgi:biotin carboxyl carrier protein
VKSVWGDGERDREVELRPLGGGRFLVRVDAAEFEVGVESLEDGRLKLTSDSGAVVAEITAADSRRFVRLGNLDFVLERRTSTRRAGASAGSGLEAPMPGLVTRVMVEAGDEVKKGQPLLALEAMKMEHLIRAPHDGRVKSVAAKVNQMASPGSPLVEIETA